MIGAVLITGARAPLLVKRQHLKTMKPGSVLVDVAVDQGGCIEVPLPIFRCGRGPKIACEGMILQIMCVCEYKAHDRGRARVSSSTQVHVIDFELLPLTAGRGGAQTCKPTTHDAPTFVVDDVLHYCVANMPGAVPYTSTMALGNATLPYALQLANQGWVDAAM